MSEIKLLPCPFCGGEGSISCDPEATKDSNGRLWAFTVVCNSCCATGGLCYSPEMATNSWNTRKPIDKVVEQLEERTEFLSGCTKYGNENAEQQEKSYSTMMMYEVADLCEDLIDIVKAGGKSD